MCVMIASVHVVDDDEDTRELLAEVLRHRGFTVSTSDCGSACLDAIAHANGDIAVVLTDVEMPGMNGIELCRTIRASYPTIVAIVMSGRVTPSTLEEVESSGAITFLRKPVDISTLDQVLRRVTSFP